MASSGRINESLCQEVEQLRSRRQEDIFNAVSVLRAELTSNSNEITELQSKRRSALELLSKYQIKISELVENNRSYVRQDAEQKAQIYRFKSELNNMQTLLETQSQTIQTYRLHSASIGSKDKHVDEMEDALRKKCEELKKQESISRDLERSVDQLGEQLVALNKRLLDRETTIVGLNVQIARMSFDFKRRTTPNSPKQDNSQKENQVHDDQVSSYFHSSWNSDATKERNRGSLTPERFVRQNPAHGNTEFGNVDFISQLERLGVNRTSTSSIGDQGGSFLSPPPSIPSPPRRYSDIDAGTGRIRGERTMEQDDESRRGAPGEGKADRKGIDASSDIAFTSKSGESNKTVNQGVLVQNSASNDVKASPNATDRLSDAPRRPAILSSAAATALSSSSMRTVKNVKAAHFQNDSRVKFSRASKLKSTKKVVQSVGKARTKQLNSEQSKNSFTGFHEFEDDKLSPQILAPKRGRAMPETPGGAFVRDALNSRDSLYDPAFFDLLDDIDSSHSTISSISRHGGLMWP